MRRASAAALLGALLAAGCASDPPGARDFVDLSAPVRSSVYHVETWGRTVVVEARVKLGGASLEALRVIVTGVDGKPGPAAPTIVVGGEGVPSATYSVDGAGAVATFATAVPDGVILIVEATVPEGSPDPFSLRLEPLVRR